MKKDSIKLYRIKVSGEDIIGISFYNKKEKSYIIKYPMTIITEYNEDEENNEDKKILIFKFWLNNNIVSQNTITFLENELWELKLKEDLIELYLNMLNNLSSEDEEDANSLVNVSDEDKKDIQLLLEDLDMISNQTIIH